MSLRIGSKGSKMGYRQGLGGSAGPELEMMGDANEAIGDSLICPGVRVEFGANEDGVVMVGKGNVPGACGDSAMLLSPPT